MRTERKSDMKIEQPRFSLFASATWPTVVYTLSLHDALPIFGRDDGTFLVGDDPLPLAFRRGAQGLVDRVHRDRPLVPAGEGRKSTRLNSSHGYISYAAFCLKKKKRFTPYAISFNLLLPSHPY